MKSRKIRTAYNSINPTQEQKEKMLSAIVSQLPEEKPARNQYRKTNPRTRRRNWTPVAAGFAILIVTGVLGFGFFSGKAKPEPVSPQEEISLQDPVLVVPGDSMTGNDGYDHIMNKYVTALTEHWSKVQCFENDISTIAASNPDYNNNLGWCLMDIDSNGIEELIISYGNTLVDLYSIKPDDISPEKMIKDHGDMEYALPVENGICHLAKSEGGIQYSLCEDGTVVYQIIFEKGTSWCYYKVQPWGLELQNVLMYHSENEGHNAYSYGLNEDDQKYISMEEAGNIIVSHQPMKLQVTPIVDWDTYGVYEPSSYDSLIELYRQAVQEDWDPGKCIENGISLMVGYYGDYVEELGYATVDLDNNGIHELIITDGTNIYDLYTISHDETDGALRLVDATERNQFFLTTEGYIYNMGSGGAMVSSHILYTIGEKELTFVEGYLFDAASNPSAPWYYYDGEEQGEPCPNSVAGAATDAIVFADISFIPFT